MNKKVLFIIISILLFISISINIVFFSYVNEVKSITNGVVNALVDNNTIDDNVINILNESDSNKLKEYGITSNDFSVNLLNKSTTKYIVILNVIVCIICILLIMYNLYVKYLKESKLKELTNLIRDINNKKYILDMKGNYEGSEYLLKSELYKTVVMLNNISENSINDKISVKTSIEDLSHQLKTPLTCISIILDNLIDNPDMESTLRNSFIKDIDKEISKINYLVNTMLKLSRFDVNSVTFDRKLNSIESIINKAIDNVSVIMDLKGVSVNLNIDKSVNIMCDFNYEVEAISNILKNEVEYSFNNGIIDIEVSDNLVYTLVKIRDYGKGISKIDIDNIFKRFYKGSESNTSSVGIGLSLAKKIIEMDNGKISVESNKESTCFIIKYFK